MNYDERIAALTSFQSAISSAGSTIDNVSGLSTDISGWEGNSKRKFEEYIEIVKTRSSSISKRKEQFLREVQKQIDTVKNQLEMEVAQFRYITTMTYDSKSVQKNQTLQRSVINSLNVDESVKIRLLNMI